jgi:hypothetical protein
MQFPVHEGTRASCATTSYSIRFLAGGNLSFVQVGACHEPAQALCHPLVPVAVFRWLRVGNADFMAVGFSLAEADTPRTVDAILSA